MSLSARFQVQPLLGLMLALAVCNSGLVFAAETGEGRQEEANAPPFISEGKILLNVRGRYEFADQAGRDESNAYTIRTRAGVESGAIHGFRFLAEMEDVRVIGDEDRFNPFPVAGKTVIADPEGTELNRLQASYKNADTAVVVGRQRIILDGARFIGNVGWRQNEQTYDAVGLKNQSIENLSVYYGYIDEVHRIFGDDAPSAALREFESDSHLFNLSYGGLEIGKITAYAYLLDFANARANSTDTFGAFLSGNLAINEDLKLNYHLEYARQNEGRGNPAEFGANYFHLNFGASLKGVQLGAGYEELGADNAGSFRTPLATLHKFNGWADAFLNTPSSGLEDIYLSAGTKLGKKIPVKLIYHSFGSDRNNLDFGDEIDALISWKIDKHWTVLAKYAYFDAKGGGRADIERFWLQLEFNY